MRSLRLGLLLLFFGTGIFSGAFAGETVPGEVIVKLKKHKTHSVAAASTAFAFKMRNKMELKSSWPEFGMHHYKAHPGQTTEDLIAQLKDDPEVEYVEPNYVLKKQGGEVTGQMYSYSQVSTFATGFGLTSAPMSGTQAWTQITGTNKPIVAVIDTGIDLNHPSLANAIWVNPGEIANNGIDDDRNGYVDDVHGWNFVDGNNNVQDCDGHGTHVSGIVRGTTQYIFDETSIPTPLIKVMPVKFLDCTGSGSTANGINAIYYAVNNGAKVLNNSWGGGDYSRALDEAIYYTYTSQKIFVAAAGNSSSNNDSTKTYPGSYGEPNIISVAATYSSDSLAWFSNFGTGSVQVAAPGVSILSTYPDFGYPGNPSCSTVGNPYQGCFANLDGTSMAAPFVAGIAALVVNEKPQMNGYQVKNIILNKADKISALSGLVATGARVNSQAAVIEAKAESINAGQPGYQIPISGSDRSLASAVASGGAGSCGLVRALRNGDGPRNPPPPIGTLLVLVSLVLLPLLLTRLLKRPIKRQHPRFAINTQIRLKVGEDELEGNLSTISVGGAGVQTEALLDKGSLVTVKIHSPDGKELEVEGRIVWRSADQGYGVAFDKPISNSILSRIQSWARRLVTDS